MNSLSRQKRAWTILLFCLIPAILMIRGFWSMSHPRTLKKLSPPEGHQKEVVEKWQNASFVELSRVSDLHEIVTGFQKRFDEPLDDEEKTALDESVVNLVTAMHTGTFEDYMRFRVPVDEFEFPQGVSKAMMNRLKIPESEITERRPEAAFRIYWNKFVNTNYSNLWIGLSMSNCEIQVRRSLSPTNDLVFALNHSSATLKYDSISDVKVLANALKRASDPASISYYLLSHLTPSTSNLLVTFDFAATKDWYPVQKVVLKDLNEIIQSGPLYSPERFKDVQLSTNTLQMIQLLPTGDQLVLLNRWLLTDSYPYAFRRLTVVENAGLTISSPVILLKPSRADILISNKYLKEAIISILPKPRGNYAAVPVYVSLYWSPNDKKWLPEQLVVASTRGDYGPLIKL